MMVVVHGDVDDVESENALDRFSGAEQNLTKGSTLQPNSSPPNTSIPSRIIQINIPMVLWPKFSRKSFNPKMLGSKFHHSKKETQAIKFNVFLQLKLLALAAVLSSSRPSEGEIWAPPLAKG